MSVVDIQALTQMMQEVQAASFDSHEHLANGEKTVSSQIQTQPPMSTNTKVVNRPAKVGVDLVKGNKPNSTSQVIQKKKDPKEIWNEDDIVDELTLLSQVVDNRPPPKYTYFYHNDIGINMLNGQAHSDNNSSNASQHASHLVIKVHLPGASLREIDVDLRSTVLLLTSRTNRLYAPLPVDVDAEHGKAAFDNSTSVLSITVPIIKEF